MKSPMNLLDCLWTQANNYPSPTLGEVHIWRVNLSDSVTPDIRRLFKILSSDEQQRVNKYYFKKDQNGFITVRGTLREMLSGYLSIPPKEIVFFYNGFGKPAINKSMDDESLNFNVSCSGNVALLAFAYRLRIGIDVELTDPKFPKYEVADRYFSADEVIALRSLPPFAQTLAFFQGWTIKEGYVKAVGKGLAHRMPRLLISSDKVEADPKETKGWFINSFIPKSEYVASLAYEGIPKIVRYLQWPEVKG